LQVIGCFLVNIFRLLGGIQLENARKKRASGLKKNFQEKKKIKKENKRVGTT
jgi:hypothetical protein